jgi:hypothetical protein
VSLLCTQREIQNPKRHHLSVVGMVPKTNHQIFWLQIQMAKALDMQGIDGARYMPDEGHDLRSLGIHPFASPLIEYTLQRLVRVGLQLHPCHPRLRRFSVGKDD